MTHIQVYF